MSFRDDSTGVRVDAEVRRSGRLDDNLSDTCLDSLESLFPKLAVTNFLICAGLNSEVLFALFAVSTFSL